MKPTVRIIRGEARKALASLEPSSVHCVITSPPYYGLRDYGLPPSIWGGSADCSHIWYETSYQRRSNDSTKTPKQLSNTGSNDRDKPVESAWCECGAWRGQLGLERDVDDYIDHLALVFEQVWRVLRDDGTLWLNMGDSYVSSSMKQERAGLKPKDLMGVPWRVAMKLQLDGWYLRSDIIWEKKNAMPDPVIDRPTSSHEHIFLLTKSPAYFYDRDAILEPWADERQGRSTGHVIRQRNVGNRSDGYTRPPNTWQPPDGVIGRNKRDVWSLSKAVSKDAHFAVFPPALIIPPILAGTSEAGACTACGAPWRRVIERIQLGREPERLRNVGGRSDGFTRPAQAGGLDPVSRQTVGWAPGCRCGAPRRPCVVLDPFLGTGTTAATAVQLGRSAIGVELSREHAATAAQKVRKALAETGALWDTTEAVKAV